MDSNSPVLSDDSTFLSNKVAHTTSLLLPPVMTTVTTATVLFLLTSPARHLCQPMIYRSADHTHISTHLSTAWFPHGMCRFLATIYGGLTNRWTDVSVLGCALYRSREVALTSICIHMRIGGEVYQGRPFFGC